MPTVFETAVFWTLIVIQLIGLMSVVTARLAERCNGRKCCHILFCCCLVLVGAASVLALQLGIGYSLCCGTTLAMMGIGGTIDLRRDRPAEAF